MANTLHDTTWRMPPCWRVPYWMVYDSHFTLSFDARSRHLRRLQKFKEVKQKYLKEADCEDTR